MPVGPARMPLMEHLGELRMRLVRIVVVLLVAVMVFYFAAPAASQFLLQPIAEYLPQDEQNLTSMVFLDPFEAFSVRFKVAFYLSLVATSPIILWQIVAFFLPALKPSERKWFVPTFAAGIALFIIGTVFCYFIILPPAFEWLTDQVTGMGQILPRGATYINIIIGFEIGFGIAFELPILIFYLVIFDIVPYKKLRGAWRYVYVGLMVFAAAATPDANPVTMLLMFCALVGLYEISLLLARVVLAKRIKKQNAELEEEEDEDEDEEEVHSKIVEHAEEKAQNLEKERKRIEKEKKRAAKKQKKAAKKKAAEK